MVFKCRWLAADVCYVTVGVVLNAASPLDSNGSLIRGSLRMPGHLPVEIYILNYEMWYLGPTFELNTETWSVCTVLWRQKSCQYKEKTQLISNKTEKTSNIYICKAGTFFYSNILHVFVCLKVFLNHFLSLPKCFLVLQWTNHFPPNNQT